MLNSFANPENLTTVSLLTFFEKYFLHFILYVLLYTLADTSSLTVSV